MNDGSSSRSWGRPPGSWNLAAAPCSKLISGHMQGNCGFYLAFLGFTAGTRSGLPTPGLPLRSGKDRTDIRSWHLAKPSSPGPPKDPRCGP